MKTNNSGCCLLGCRSDGGNPPLPWSPSGRLVPPRPPGSRRRGLIRALVRKSHFLGRAVCCFEQETFSGLSFWRPWEEGGRTLSSPRQLGWPARPNVPPFQLLSMVAFRQPSASHAPVTGKNARALLKRTPEAETSYGSFGDLLISKAEGH